MLPLRYSAWCVPAPFLSTRWASFEFIAVNGLPFPFLLLKIYLAYLRWHVVVQITYTALVVANYEVALTTMRATRFWYFECVSGISWGKLGQYTLLTSGNPLPKFRCRGSCLLKSTFRSWHPCGADYEAIVGDWSCPTRRLGNCSHSLVLWQIQGLALVQTMVLSRQFQGYAFCPAGFDSLNDSSFGSFKIIQFHSYLGMYERHFR
jgi:hypothetical protein